MAILFRQGMRIVKHQPFPYWHLDMHAGCGWNIEVDCPGSPVTFVETAGEVGKQFRAFFCERDDSAAMELLGRLAYCVEKADDSLIAVRCLDNKEVLREFAAAIEAEERPEFATGSVLVDPNGWNPDDVPTEELIEFFRRFTRIDLVLNVNFSLFARVRGCKGNHRTPGFDNFPDPRDVLGFKAAKRRWMVRNPPGGFNGDKFALFVGRNTDFGMGAFEDFYPDGSPQWDEIVSKLRRVNVGQGNLFGDV